MTIAEAIKAAIQQAGKPLSAKEAFEIIQKSGLYTFKAKNPESIVASTVRKHCKGIERKGVQGKCYFVEVAKGKYGLV